MSENKTTGIYFFTNDLRLSDNPALHRISKEVDQLLCVFCYPKWWSEQNQQNFISLGKHRASFLVETLTDLNEQLKALGQTVIATDYSPLEFIEQIATSLKISKIIRSQNAGYYENHEWRTLKQNFECEYIDVASHTLFAQNELPFELKQLPESFSKFRKLVESNLSVDQPLPKPTQLPPPPIKVDVSPKKLIIADNMPSELVGFTGGETAAHIQLDYYFSGRLPSHYKEVRNSLDGWDNSSKFSPWLANGSLSVKDLVARIKHYEQNVEQNSSTYWLYFELLWREYFQWYAHLHGAKLFSYRGIKKRNPLTSYYPERFQKWCSGNTPYPLVNSCMRELSQTGYLSNRGRQIVASCLVNELSIDWRYGAAYFEHQLLDYDVASNWGNWQYLAGVGADPRDKRHFNLDKQTELFDPDELYRNKWGVGAVTSALDSVDAADWPIG